MLREFFAGVVFAIAALPSFAFAETDPPPSITPLEVVSDRSGVNITTGLTKVDLPTLSIPAAPRLAFSRLQDVAPYVTGTIPGGEADGRTSGFSAHTGSATSEAFRCRSDICRSVNGNGAQILDVGLGMQVTVSGTAARYFFDQKSVDITNSTGLRNIIYYASSVQYPDGEVISYTYQTFVSGSRTYYRPTRVDSSTGYSISLTYHTAGYTAGWQTPKDATLYATASSSVALAKFSYSSDATTITDIAGRVYTCSGCTNDLGAVETWAGSIKLPGESSPAKNIVARTDYPVVGTVSVDGVAFTYNYQNIRINASGAGYNYDALTVTHPDNGVDRYNIFVSDKRNFITSHVDRLGRTTTFQYDMYNRPTLITYPGGNKAGAVYDDYGNIVTKTTIAKPNSGLSDTVETAGYDASCSGVLCYRPSWTKDAKGQQTGQQTDYLYNGAGQITEQTDPADAAGVRRKTYTTYTSTGLSRPSVIRICGAGSTCGTADETRTEIDYWGNTSLPIVKREIDAAQNVTLTTTYTYDSAGRLTSIDGPAPGTDDTQFFRYDALGRKTWEVSGRGPNGLYLATRYTYRDSDDRVTSVATGTITTSGSTDLVVLKKVDTTYDGRRYPWRVATGSSSSVFGVVSRSFSDRGKVVCETVRMDPGQWLSQPDPCVRQTTSANGPDRTTLNMYDAADQLIQVHKAVGSNVQQAYATYSYTPNGKVEYTIDANGNRAKMEYDGFDRLKNWIFPSPVRPSAYTPSNQANALATAGAPNGNDYEQYGYDANGNRTSLRKRDGSTLTYQYDALNRVTVKGVPERGGLAGTHTRDVYYNYDARGLMTAARFDGASGADSAVTAYDGLGRISSSTITMDAGTAAVTSRALSYAYDNDGNRTKITHPDNVYFRSSYDALDRLTSYWWKSPGVAEVAFGVVTYKTNGQRGSIVHGSSTTAYDYGADQRLSYVGQSFYNNVGNGAQTFLYNPSGQLVQESRDNFAYTFTARYNVSRNYDANGLNQYAGTTSTTAAGTSSNTFCHDANGNLIADGVYVYLYDVENRLVEKRQRATTSCASFAFDGPLMAQMRYDPMGRLYEAVGPVTGTTRMLYDGDKLTAEYDDAGALLRRYYWGDRTDEPVVWSEGPGLDCANARTQFLHTDRQGSIVASADCYGNFVRTWRYDEYGIPQSSDGSSLTPGNGARFLYTGQAFIPDAGLYYYKARMYSPSLGRFLQTDPIGYKDQINLYGYVANDPINNTDPSGLARVCTPETGSNVPACVGVDGNGDGNSRDNDLSSGQRRTLGSQFHNAILANRGRDLSKSGKSVTGSASADEKAMTRAVSQFVGATVGKSIGWSSVRGIRADGDKGAFGYANSSCGGHAAAACYSFEGDYIWITGQRLGLFSGSSYSPSELARLLIHESMHSIFGPLTADTWGHLQMDSKAQGYLKGAGLGGGGCSGGSGLYSCDGP